MSELRPVSHLAEKFQKRLAQTLAEVREARDSAEDAEEEDSAERRVGRHLLECGLPPKSVKWIQENGGVPALLERDCGRLLEAFMAGEKLVAVLQGGVGAGKTTLSAIALMHARRKVHGWDEEKRQPTWEWELDSRLALVKHAAKAGDIKPRFSEDAPKMRELEEVPLLVLDDLGVSDTDSTAEVVERVLCERDANLKRTVITTNLDTKEIRLRYGPRVADRLKAEAVLISCGKESLRKKA